MATNNVSTFLSQIQQGIKPNMFSVDIKFPQGFSGATGKSNNDDKNLTNILCKAAALPGSNLGVIEVPFRGRTVKIAGDRTFDTWTATFFADSNMEIRGLFEEWANSINTHEANTATRFLPSSTSAAGYMADLYVSQLEKDDTVGGSVIRTYKLHHCFPTNVSAIDLAYDSNDQISEFTVEWQYSFFTAGTGDADKGTGAKLSVGASTRKVV
tara:strand:- start:39 stop:674 length:636 start_codon:yes stop_codon:yes gene_type:complete